MPIASTAIVHPGARVDPTAVIGDYCIIEADVEIGAHCRLDPFVIVKRYTTMGSHNHLYSGVQLGTDPLDKKFKEEPASYLKIGSHNVLREYMTISRGTAPGSATEIGDHNYVMTSVHIAHNCRIGDHNTICSNTLLGGHVLLEDHCFLSGAVLVHQFGRLGRMCMVSGNVRCNLDVPPYLTVSEFNVTAKGLNLVGMRRAGLKPDQIGAIKRAYKLLYRSRLPLEEALERIEAEIDTPEARHFVEFIRSSERGICRDRGSDHSEVEAQE